MPRYWYLGLSLNLLLAYLVFSQFDSFADSYHQWDLFNGGVAIVLIWGSLLFASLRLRSQLRLQDIHLSAAVSIKVVFVSFSFLQIVNFAGVVELVRFALISGPRKAIVKALISDKVVQYFAKSVFLLGFFFFPIWFLAGAFLVPRFTRHIVSVVYSVLGLLCLGTAFSIAATGGVSHFLWAANSLYLTSLLPTMTDWGAREWMSSSLVTVLDSEAVSSLISSPPTVGNLPSQSQAMGGSVYFGLLSLLASIPGWVFLATDPSLRKEITWKKFWFVRRTHG